MGTICIGTQFAGTQGSANPRVDSTDEGESHRHLTVSYLIELFLKSQPVEGSEGQAEEEADAPVKRLKGLAERAVNLLLSSVAAAGSGIPQCAVIG